ncbi:MAG: putative transporter [Methanomassiliicoccales archaeon PtaU1.Bin124]|nr:MAG: putative transporter [Methanomassiliicoccales archaeon PtaU1.Bin124]
MVADVVEPSKRLEAYGLLRIGQNVGWALGPVLGGIVSIWLPFSWLFLIGAVATATVSVLLWLYIEESLRQGQERSRFKVTDLGKVTHDSIFMFYCAVSVLLFMNFGQMSSTYAVYSTDTLGMTEAEVALLWSWNGIMVIFMQMPISRWISKYRMTTIISTGSMFYALGWGMVGLAGAFHLLSPWTFTFLFVNMTIVTMGEMFVSPASMNLVASISPENERGRYMGVFGLASSLGFSLGPFTAGLVLDNLAGQDILMWVTIGLFGVMAAIGYQFLGRILGKERDSSVSKA